MRSASQISQSHSRGHGGGAGICCPFLAHSAQGCLNKNVTRAWASAAARDARNQAPLMIAN